MSKTLENKSAIITGGSSGIGKAACLELAARGAKVVVADITEEEGNKVAEEIKEAGGEAIFVKTNVTEDKDIQNVIQQCQDTFGGLDIMLNNAGIGGPLTFFDQISDEEWFQIFAVNQTGVFYGMRAALKIMKTQKSGVIINTASVAGVGAAPRMGAYAASKHAVIGMTKTAAVEYAKYGIRINAVCPTVIKTPMGEGYTNEDPMNIEMVKRSIPIKRFGEAEEVARTMAWLCTDDASLVIGQEILVDGGMKA